MTEIYRQKIRDLNHRAKEAGSKGKLNAADLHAVLEFYGAHCLVPDCTNTDVQFDHVIPLEKQGPNARRNLQLLCESHNKAKRETDYRPVDKPFCPDEYVAQSKDKRERHNWDEIEFEYVTGDAGLRQLAKKFGVSESHIEAVCARDEWVKKRNLYRGKIGAEIMRQIEAQNVADGFTAYRATFMLVRRAFDDYMAFPHPDKLKAIDTVLTKALAMENRPTDNKQLIVKDWKDAPTQDVDDIQQFASAKAAEYYGGDSGGDSEPRAGWTD